MQIHTWADFWGVLAFFVIALAWGLGVGGLAFWALRSLFPDD